MNPARFVGLAAAAAWLKDTDRTAGNTLVCVQDDVARGYLIDFNSALGAWQGRPKEPWRGHRYVYDLLGPSLQVVTLGLARAEDRSYLVETLLARQARILNDKGK